MGGRLNYGNIAILFPLVITQCYLRETDPFKILDNINKVLKLTCNEDTVKLQETKNFAYSLLKIHKQNIFKVKYDYKNILDYYIKTIPNSAEESNVQYPYFIPDTVVWGSKNRVAGDGKTGSCMINREVTNNYPVLRYMLKVYFENFVKDGRQIIDIETGKPINISTAMGIVDSYTRKEFSGLNSQWFADLSTGLLYLIFSFNPKFVV